MSASGEASRWPPLTGQPSNALRLQTTPPRFLHPQDRRRTLGRKSALKVGT